MHSTSFSSDTVILPDRNDAGWPEQWYLELRKGWRFQFLGRLFSSELLTFHQNKFGNIVKYSLHLAL
jgi:hypothetical protein